MGILIALSLIGLVMFVIFNNNFLKFNQKFEGFLKALSEFLMKKIESAGVDHVPDRVQVAAPQLLYKDVKYISRLRILKDANADQMMEVLDTSWFEKYNCIMVERWVPLSVLKDILGEMEIESNDDELEDMLAPLYCERTDIYVEEHEGQINFIPDYKAPTIAIDLNEGDVEE